MGYANPILREVVALGLIDFTAAKTYTKKGPKGAAGRLRDIFAIVDTTFTNTTTSGHFKVGVSGTDGKYADLDMLVTAAGANLSASKDQAAALVAAQELPADTDVQFKIVPPTGGTPAGKAFMFAAIDWY